MLRDSKPRKRPLDARGTLTTALRLRPTNVCPCAIRKLVCGQPRWPAAAAVATPLAPAPAGASAAGGCGPVAPFCRAPLSRVPFASAAPFPAAVCVYGPVDPFPLLVVPAVPVAPLTGAVCVGEPGVTPFCVCVCRLLYAGIEPGGRSSSSMLCTFWACQVTHIHTHAHTCTNTLRH